VLLILVGIGVFLIINQNEVRQQIIPPPTPTATRTARSYVVEAEALAQTGNLKAAADAYIQAVSLEPTNVDVLIALARLLSLIDRPTEAVTWAERAAQLAPQSAPAQAALAQALDWQALQQQQQGRESEAKKTWQQALDVGKSAVALDPAYPEGQAYLAEIYAELNDVENAVVSIQRALDLNSNRVDVQRALGSVHEAQGDYVGAAEAYRKATELAPNIAYLYLVLGRSYRIVASTRDSSQWANALSAFQHGSLVDPTNVTMLDELGWTNYQMEQYRDAQEILEKAVTLDPQAWSPRSHLAATYFARTNYEEAINSFNIALDLMNKTFDADHFCVTAQTQACSRVVAAYTTLGYAHWQLGQCVDGAMAAFRKVLVLRPDDPTAQGGLNLCAKSLGTSVPDTPTPK
jgi:tetratricopeptide (TPR) repeat protein